MKKDIELVVREKSLTIRDTDHKNDLDITPRDEMDASLLRKVERYFRDKILYMMTNHSSVTGTPTSNTAYLGESGHWYQEGNH